MKSSGAKKQPACEIHATRNPSYTVQAFDQLFKNILPAFVKIAKPSVPKFGGNSLEYSKFKAAFNVEVDKGKSTML